jgi:hypothetical protein
MSRVMDSSEALATDRLVLLVMANRAGGDHDECFASVERIAHECRLAHRTVQYAQRALEESGDLALVGVHPKYRTNIYAVMPVSAIRPMQDMHPPAPRPPARAPKQKKRQRDLEPRLKSATPVASVDNRPDHDQVSLAEKITATWNATPSNLGLPALQRLNNTFGRPAVTDALRSLHGFPPEEAVRSPFAYVESICQAAVSA